MKRYRVTLAADVMAESAQQARNAVTEVKFAVEPCDWGVLHVEEVPNSQSPVPNSPTPDEIQEMYDRGNAT